MKIFQVLTIFTAAMLLSILAIAQPGQGRGQGQRPMMTPEQRQAQMEKMADDLALSEEQKEAYFKIEDDFAQKMRQLRTENQGDFAAMREGMQALRQERDEAVKAILNEEQIQKYETIMANRQGPGANGQARAQQAQEENKGGTKEKKAKKSKKSKGGDGEN